MCTFMFSHHSLTLKKSCKLIFVTTKGFPAYAFPLKVHCTLQTSRTSNKRDIGTLILTRLSLTLKEWSTLKSDTTKRCTADGFLKVDYTLQTSKTNNKQDIGTFILKHPSLTLTEKSKVKSDITKRFTAYGFLKVDYTLQISRTNNKRVIRTFILTHPCLTLK